MTTRIEVTTKIGCPCMCEYCAQDKILARYNSDVRELTLENTKKFFKSIPKPTIVSLAGFSEPLRAKEIVDIAKWLVADGRKLQVFSTLYQVDKSVIRKLFSIEGVFFRLHMPDKEGRTKIKLDDTLISNFALATKLMHIHNNAYASCCWGTTPDELLPYISGDHVTDLRFLTDFAGNVEGVDYLNHNYKKGKLTCNRCNYPLILPDGRVSMCAQDWSLNYVIGDLNKQTYNEIFESEPYLTYKGNCDTEDAPTLCRFCSDSKVVKE